MEQNTQLELAHNFVEFTNRNIFLTGKAGTGKTTFLHRLKKTSQKRLTVVAPTGVAAINAGGVTINSFFQLPFGPFVPGDPDKNAQQKRFSRDKINLIKSLDLLVIDEISMVRADTLDQIDDVLRKYRNRSLPFGGVQLLMIGDLHQLSPVIKDDDWAILRPHYPNLYFFSSQALLRTNPISIELKHIYRQADDMFIDLLNKVRKNEIDDEVLNVLNQRYIPGFKPSNNDGYITLTTHNKSAQEINDNRLAEIDAPVNTFLARVEDEFPEYSYPTVAELQLKQGAQVMFVKNDSSNDKLYYNGKIGTVVKVENEVIYVKCPNEHSEILVRPVEWTNIKYTLNTETKEVNETIIGKFIQHPLKLAWAITIHKSQGLTFEKAIIDANLAFAHGQVYVALSRCKSFEGMVLHSPIAVNSVKTDNTVAEYSRHASNSEPNEQELKRSKVAFQQALLFELFDFTHFKTLIYQLNKIYEDHHHTLDKSFMDVIAPLKAGYEKEIESVAATFRRQLASLLTRQELPEENPELQERLKKGSEYFDGKLETVIRQQILSLNTDTDNQGVGSALKDLIDEFLKELSIKTNLLKLCVTGFSTSSYIRTKANSDIDFVSAKQTSRPPTRIPSNTLHPELYLALQNWRRDLAEERSVPAYHILAQKSFLELIGSLPTTLKELEQIKGIGKVKIKQFGSEILDIVNTYCREKGIERSVMEIPETIAPEKVNTKQISLEMFKGGKTITEIAAERSLTTSTIENHLSTYILSGEISVFELVTKLNVAKIMAFIVQNPGKSTSDAKNELGEAVSYNDLRAVQNHLRFINNDLDNR